MKFMVPVVLSLLLHISSLAATAVTGSGTSGDSAGRGGGDADAAWWYVAGLIEHVPPEDPSSPPPMDLASFHGHRLWQEFSNRQLRDSGMEFTRRFPNDARVWTWFAAARKRAPRYWDLAEVWRVRAGASMRAVLDQTAQQEWRLFDQQLRERAIHDAGAPTDLRIEFWSLRIREPLRSFGIAVREDNNVPLPDLDRLGEDLLELGKTFPAAKDIQLRSATSILLRVAERYAPDKAIAWQVRLAASVNQTIAEVAAGRDAIEEAKVTPMEMRFTAIDGRQVDLRELRGKVVLLDFRGVTWCGACRMEEPYMRDAYAKYREQGFEIVTITFESKESSRDFVLRYTQENGLVWPHYFDGKGSQNPYIKRFGITAVPQHFLLNQEGLLVSTDARGKKLEEEVRRLLGL